MSLENLKSIAALMMIVSTVVLGNAVWMLRVDLDPSPIKLLACGLLVVAVIAFFWLIGYASTDEKTKP